MAALIRPGLQRRLEREVRGEVLFNAFARGRYATDASIYQMMPAGVVIPQSVEDVECALSAAREEGVPLTMRGGGTSQCGQTVNTGLIVDTSQHLTGLLELDVDSRRAVVQPGIVLDQLNRLLKPHGLWFPVDVSTASRATIGGMAANNSCGARSLRYGTMRDNTLAIDAIMADGTRARFGPVEQGSNRATSDLVADLLSLGRREADEIGERFPQVQRRVGGYNLDALLPDANPLNLAHILVGSEGTLGISTAIEIQLWPLPPKNKVMGACHFPTFRAAMEAAQHLVKLEPTSVELVDATMIALARDIAMYRPTLESFVRGNPAALLLVEFADEPAENQRKVSALEDAMSDLGFAFSNTGPREGGVIQISDPALQAAIAELRAGGLNIMMSMRQEGKPVSFVEDCAVPLEHLADYTDRLTAIFEKHGTRGTWYAHASVGCLHVRPILNMKLEKDASAMRAIAEEAFAMVREYKGSHSGEHGDGIVRSEFHEQMFGSRIARAFEEVKDRFDPVGILNPGKIVRAPRMNNRELFRYPPGYTFDEIRTGFDWSAWPGASGGFQGAVEMCNNNGACRKHVGGVMCPSYRVTRNERDVTRGRANTLRLALSGQIGADALHSDEMAETLKLCVSCKACRRECPTGVDMARMKTEILYQRGLKNGIGLQQRLIAELPRYAPWASRVGGVMAMRDRWRLGARLSEKVIGFSHRRSLPRFAKSPFRDSEANTPTGKRKVVLFADTFGRWFEPATLRAAVSVLSAGNYAVETARPAEGRNRPLCCGRTYLAAGMIDKAREEAARTLEALRPALDSGAAIVGLEPSCILTMRDEFLSLLPGDEARRLSQRAQLIEEFLGDEAERGELDLVLAAPAPTALLHGHCHQKAFATMGAVERTLRLIPGMDVETVESSCCGMAGAFGYDAETIDVSLAMGELSLLPAVRSATGDTIIVADGTSCRHQIGDGTGRKALHVAEVLASALETARNTKHEAANRDTMRQAGNES
ncbi:FAD-binding and (Fe-S)-binding domain-containing protein [Oricola cellulosilytica]|uniref:D-2-hydroxyglutarate dehydrogenase n=1 Tax=Oricola cellulosilytica TaxID=1429082 RepID=A0A4R0PCM2_9HYPH|nr:FAD-binding and (Fe-S)-binding domain-containing protein [Oricola cellulosilytica]TCD14208.1 FAD-binding oxidoreductase [Oricola cellulosilytica]